VTWGVTTQFTDSEFYEIEPLFLLVSARTVRRIVAFTTSVVVMFLGQPYTEPLISCLSSG
jgi:hypothetical protein